MCLNDVSSAFHSLVAESWEYTDLQLYFTQIQISKIKSQIVKIETRLALTMMCFHLCFTVFTYSRSTFCLSCMSCILPHSIAACSRSTRTIESWIILGRWWGQDTSTSHVETSCDVLWTGAFYQLNTTYSDSHYIWHTLQPHITIKFKFCMPPPKKKNNNSP